MRSEGYNTRSVGLSVSVCLSTRVLALQRPMSGTNGLLNNENIHIMWPFSWNDCVPEIWLVLKPYLWKAVGSENRRGQRAIDRARAIADRLLWRARVISGSCAYATLFRRTSIISWVSLLCHFLSLFTLFPMDNKLSKACPQCSITVHVSFNAVLWLSNHLLPYNYYNF